MVIKCVSLCIKLLFSATRKLLLDFGLCFFAISFCHSSNHFQSIKFLLYPRQCMIAMTKMKFSSSENVYSYGRMAMNK